MRGTVLDLRAPFLALAAFLFAGDLKADPRWARIPVDLTLLTGAVLSGVLAARAAREGLAEGPWPWVLGLWWLTFAPGVLQAAPTPYAFQKVATLFTFSLLSALAPCVLVRSARDVARAGDALVLFALAMTLDALLGGVRGGSAGSERLQAFGAGTIALGRAAGFLFVAAALRLARGAAPAWPWLAALALAGLAAFRSGARGPLASAVLVGGLAPLLARRPPDPGEARRARLGALRLGAALVLLVGVLALTRATAPQGSAQRVEAFLRGEFGPSEAFRADALARSWTLLRDAPGGLGWGGFATFADPLKGMGRQYPHNLLAEVALEGGWAAGAATVAVLALSAASAWRGSGTQGGLLALGGLAFYGLNALVSGDVNDNRPLFLFIGCVLARLPQGGAP